MSFAHTRRLPGPLAPLLAGLSLVACSSRLEARDQPRSSAPASASAASAAPSASIAIEGDDLGGPAGGRYVSRIKLPKGPWKTFAKAEVSCGLREDRTIACFNRDGTPAVGYAPKGTFKVLKTHLTAGCAIGDDDLIRCFGDDGFFKTPRPPGIRARDVAFYGSLLCWVNESGAIACAADANSHWAPATVAKPQGEFSAIECTGHTCCALATDGKIACFGEDKALLTPPAGHFTSVGVDGVLGCALDDRGEVHCWGDSYEVPKIIPPGPFASLSVSSWKTCGVKKDGHAICFGRFAKRPIEHATASRYIDGDCGIDTSGEIYCDGSDFFGPIPSGSFKDISGGNDIMCALRADGRARCWGTDGDVFAGVPKAPLRQIDFGSICGCALDEHGELSCWGSNYGAVEAPKGRFASLTTGAGSCALDPTGHASCWGHLKGKPPTEPVKAMSAGEATTCALTNDGHIRCFETFGYIDDHVESEPPPRDADYTTVVVGYEHGCALKKTGEAKCWGRDTAGEISAPAGKFKALTLGEKRSCGLHDDGTVDCWGGDPAPAPSGVRFTKIALTTDKDLQTPSFVCGLAEPDGHVVCWAYEK